jgi:hypothetical protein
MKKLVTSVLALTLAVASVTAAFAAGPGPFYVKGDYYAGSVGTWNFDAGNTMTLAGGVWSATVTSDQGGGRHEWKAAVADWSESYFPWCNNWVHTFGPGDVVTFTLDTNVYADGWLPAQDIVWSDHFAPPGTTFEVIGGAPETGSWGSGVAAAQLGTVWTRILTIATPGSYEAKFRATGSWDICNVGSEGAGAPCGANLTYATSTPNQDVKFEFNQATGRARVTVENPVPTNNRSWGAVKSIYR